ncbi:hypothetical protein DY000_02030355 [Brassica cretica]|uniref:Disease resistance protein Roq1-like winged-helix domain-containing protein n=1 Tax=Brassica cretica TaxID=69181 RepID=A0ABQ7DMJ2_BRACR|nr:hypothetical protein DY000_02030355 [Brassica cretica]
MWNFHLPKEALEILCLSAFKQSYVRDDFEVVANKVTNICGNLPLGLCVVGSSLRGESKEEWELHLSRIENNLDRKIEDVLRVGYDRLSRKDQYLFLHIACFFNNNFHHDNVDYVTSMLTNSNLDVENGLKTPAVKSLVQIETHFHTVVMHSLLQQLGRQVVHEQSDEPGKRQFLVEPEEIRDVLTKETARNGNTLRIAKDMKSHLKLLYWPDYPRKHLPPKFQPKNLIEISMRNSHILEKIWGGIQPLPNLKNITLSHCSRLKEIPNLSEATNLETLSLSSCSSLVELPSSVRNLHKPKELDMSYCKKLRVIPTNINLVSLEIINMSDCSQLRTFPDISSNIKYLYVTNTKIEDIPPSVVGRWSRLEWLNMGSRRLKILTYIPLGVTNLELSNSGIKWVPDCVTGIPCLKSLNISNCRKLVSLQSLPPSLRKLYTNEEARRAIIQRWDYKSLLLPSKKVPAEFTLKGNKNSITISSMTFSASSRFKACLLLSPTQPFFSHNFVCRLSRKGVIINELKFSLWNLQLLTEHLVVFSGDLFEDHICLEADTTSSDIMFEFSGRRNTCCRGNYDKNTDYIIIGCGVQILAEEGESSSSRFKEHKDEAIKISKDESVVKGSKHKS